MKAIGHLIIRNVMIQTANNWHGYILVAKVGVAGVVD